MMRLSQPIFRSESAWKELMDRNEKLAIEVGRLRGEIRNLRKKNSSLLAWKLKVDPLSRYDLPIFHDKGTQTESISVLLDSSNPYKTPLRVKSVSQQNSALEDSSYSHAQYVAVYEDNYKDSDKSNLIEIQKNMSPTRKTITPNSNKTKTKAKNRRRSSTLFSLPLSNNENKSHLSPKQLEVTQGLEERIRNETMKEKEEEKEVEKEEETFKLQPEDRRRASVRESFAHQLVTPDRPSRSVKKVVTYKEPSLRVKVRKGFQFFKFADTPIAKDKEDRNQSQSISQQLNSTNSLIDALQEEEEEEENEIDNEAFAMYHPEYYSPEETPMALWQKYES